MFDNAGRKLKTLCSIVLGITIFFAVIGVAVTIGSQPDRPDYTIMALLIAVATIAAVFIALLATATLAEIAIDIKDIKEQLYQMEESNNMWRYSQQTNIPRG